MRRAAVLITVMFLLSGCAGIKKTFNVVADPHDADIRVISGAGKKARSYRSPAEVSVRVSKNPALAAAARLEVSRESYRPQTIALSDIKDGETIDIKLEKMVRYRLKFRLVSPAKSEEIKFQDAVLAVSFTVGEQSFGMDLVNRTSHTLKILWDRAAYTDVANRPHRLIYSGIRFQDRNNPVPAQPVPPRSSVQQAITPVGSVTYSPQKKTYEVLPLFSLEGNAALELKGRVFYLFIPVEVDRQIIPYNYKIEIADVIKE